MAKTASNVIPIPSERIESQIYFLRGKKVMFDRDLAVLYGVQTKVFNQAVKRNKKRFPDDDFMFQLNKLEFDNFESLRFQEGTSKEEADLRSQTVTLKTGRGKHTKYLPTVFTEQGVAMLSSVLNSERAIQVNIQIIKTFTRLRRLIASNKEILEKVERMERKYDAQLKVVFDALRKLLAPPEETREYKIGFGTQ